MIIISTVNLVISYILTYFSVCSVLHKPTLAMRLVRNPSHPNNRALIQQKFQLSFPDVYKRNPKAVSNLKLRTLTYIVNHTVPSHAVHRWHGG